MVILNSSTRKTTVIVVDDSAVMREIISDVLSSDPDIEVVEKASDPYDAREKIKALNPDVITLDINMPRMDGLSFLEKIMTLRPMPVVMISSLTEKGAKETIEALSLGAVDYIAKPSGMLENNFSHIASEICFKVKTAAKAKVKAREVSKGYVSKAIPVNIAKAQRTPIVAIGSSTGGVEALTEIFSALPETCPPIVVVQHMPPKFTASFAARLDKMCKPHVCEAEDKQQIERGTIYIAPGDRHMRIKSVTGKLFIDLFDGENVSGHKPSVDVLFHSLSETLLKNSLGIILTGMGRDGALGLKKVHEMGAKTYAQNEESSLVYGMPRAAKEIGAIDAEMHLKNIASLIMGVDH